LCAEDVTKLIEDVEQFVQNIDSQLAQRKEPPLDAETPLDACRCGEPDREALSERFPRGLPAFEESAVGS
jgi:hypothetical protein